MQGIRPDARSSIPLLAGPSTISLGFLAVAPRCPARHQMPCGSLGNAWLQLAAWRRDGCASNQQAQVAGLMHAGLAHQCNRVVESHTAYSVRTAQSG